MNYTQLEQAIQDYCESSETSFVSHINDFIRGAEDAVFSALTGPLYWKVTEDAAMVASTSEYEITSGAIDVVDFYVNGADASTDGNEIKQVDHSFLRNAFPQRSTTVAEGVPRYYAIIKSEVSSGEPTLTVKVAPAPDAAYTYTISYYGKSTTDSITSGNTPGGGATTTTWLSVAYPDVLLNGSLERAYIYLKGNSEEVARYGNLFKEQLTLLKNTAEGRIPTDGSTPTAAAQTKGI